MEAYGILKKDEAGRKFILHNGKEILVSDTPPTSQPANILGSKCCATFGLNLEEMRQRESEMELVYVREQVEALLNVVTGLCKLPFSIARGVVMLGFRTAYQFVYFFSGFWLLKRIWDFIK